MSDDIETLRAIYGHFNTRDIEGVLAALTDDVTWANAMEGGHVHGHDGVRDYWTRQWRVVRPRVEPLGFEVRPDGTIAVAVRQSVFDLEGRPLEGEAHGLEAKSATHLFRLRDGRIARFDVDPA